VRLDPPLRWRPALAARWVSPLVADPPFPLGDLRRRLAVSCEDHTVVPLPGNLSLGRGVAVAWVHLQFALTASAPNCPHLPTSWTIFRGTDTYGLLARQ
jgi:hypothetical protein